MSIAAASLKCPAMSFRRSLSGSVSTTSPATIGRRCTVGWARGVSGGWPLKAWSASQGVRPTVRTSCVSRWDAGTPSGRD
jgi:hypothetical protein